jgi:hypothetical protein
MKTFCLILAAASGCAVLLAQSSALEPMALKIASEPVAEWKAGEYKVVFRLGPILNHDNGERERSVSHYQVTRKLTEHDYPVTAGVESAMSNWAFGINKELGEYLKVFTSPSGKTLLIAEQVPNDCAPCMNWILVTARDGSLVHEYLELPTRVVNPNDFDGEFPTITKVTEREIRFRYSDGHERTVAVKDVVKKEKGPTFPG